MSICQTHQSRALQFCAKVETKAGHSILSVGAVHSGRKINSACLPHSTITVDSRRASSPVFSVAFFFSGSNPSECVYLCWFTEVDCADDSIGAQLCHRRAAQIRMELFILQPFFLYIQSAISLSSVTHTDVIFGVEFSTICGMTLPYVGYVHVLDRSLHDTDKHDGFHWQQV